MQGWLRSPPASPPRLQTSPGCPSFRRERGVFAIFVEIGVEDALIHQVLLSFDGEDHPPQVVRLEYPEHGRIIRDRSLHDLGVFVQVLFPSRFDLCDDGEAVTRRCLRIDRPYLPCSTLSSKNPPSGIAMAAGFVQSSCFALSDMSASSHPALVGVVMTPPISRSPGSSRTVSGCRPRRTAC